MYVRLVSLLETILLWPVKTSYLLIILQIVTSYSSRYDQEYRTKKLFSPLMKVSGVTRKTKKCCLDFWKEKKNAVCVNKVARKLTV